jgi:uncharacterized protein with HEPN domain
MRERIERIEGFVAGLERDDFLHDAKTSDAVVRNLEIIGEAAARLPEEFRRSSPEVPWARIVGLRNRVVHAYFDVDLEIVWTIVSVELPALKERLSALGAPDDSDGSAPTT